MLFQVIPRGSSLPCCNSCFTQSIQFCNEIIRVTLPLSSLAAEATDSCKERIFKNANSAAKCTYGKHENLLPIVLKWLQCKNSSKVSDPLHSLRQANFLSAKKLPPFAGTVFKPNFVKRVHSYQDHLHKELDTSWFGVQVSGGTKPQIEASTMMAMMMLTLAMLVHSCCTLEMHNGRCPEVIK